MKILRAKRRPFTYAPAFGVAILLLVAGYLMIRQTATSAPSSKALEEYLAAGRSKQCSRVWSHLSARTRELMLAFGDRQVALTEEQAMERYCSYTPGTSDMEKFVPGTSRTESVEGSSATAYAKYKYDRFFGFFGEGTADQRFKLVKERGHWKIDYTEEVDPQSRSNLDQEALRLVYQGWSAQRQFHLEHGSVTSDQAQIRAELPGYTFGPIVGGIADATTPRGTLHIAVAGRDAACISARSGSGTLVMVKMLPGAERGLTYQYGVIPRVCDRKPLQRDYPGSSAKIRYSDR